jgi:hypothetical protein
VVTWERARELASMSPERLRLERRPIPTVLDGRALGKPRKSRLTLDRMIQLTRSYSNVDPRRFEFDRPRQTPRTPTYGEREAVEVRSPQQARDMASNKALPLTSGQREDLKRLADTMEAEQ